MNRNTIKTFVLLAGLGGSFVIVGGLLAPHGGAAIGLVLGLGFVGGAYWFSDQLAVHAAGAHPVVPGEQPELAAIVGDLAQRAGLPMPKLYVSAAAQPNAFATGRSPKHASVCVTEGALELLNRDELRGVLAHELSHVANRDILIGSVAAAVAMAITFLARMAMFGSLLGGGRGRRGNPIGMLAMMVLAPLAAMLIQLALSRSREFEADRRGAGLLGTGEPLARRAGPDRRRRPAHADGSRPGPRHRLHRQPLHWPYRESFPAVLDPSTHGRADHAAPPGDQPARARTPSRLTRGDVQ
jgi:heat shock protein HtpX